MSPSVKFQWLKKKREAQHGTLQEAQQGFGETRRHLETASRVVGDNMTLLSDG